MRTVLIGTIFVLALAGIAAAQSFTVTGSQCGSVTVDGQATIALQVTGATWSGTVQPKIAIAGQAPVNLQIAPANSSTKQSTITANGAYVASVAGYSLFQLCGATVTNTATIYVNVSRFIH